MTADGYIKGWRELHGEALLKAVLRARDMRVAVTTSFGAESAVLLDMVARIDPSTPVLFVDTGCMFGETLAYRDRLVAHLDLLDVRTLKPSPALVANLDPNGDLHAVDPDACCQGRKVTPFAMAASGFDVVVTGRKRHHGAQRSNLPSVEVSGWQVKVNPLARFSPRDIADVFTRRKLPRHPLADAGYPSIGCAPCTAKTCARSGARSGRWPGRTKTECGIHYEHDREFLTVGT